MANNVRAASLALLALLCLGGFGAGLGVGPASAAAQANVDLLHAIPTDLAVSSAYRNRMEQVSRLVDGDTETAWNSRTGDLVGAWIEVRLPAEARVSGIRMTSGFTHRTARNDLFEGNHRVRRVRVSRDGQVVGEHALDPASRAPQMLPVRGGGGVYRVEILAVQPGSRRDWRELCVSDFQILGTAPGMSAGGQAPRMAIGALPEARTSGPIDVAALRRAARGAVDAFIRSWGRYERAQHDDPWEHDEWRPPPPVPQRATRRRIMTRIAEVTEPVDPASAGVLRAAAALEAPWDAPHFRGTLHEDDLDRIDAAMRATLERVGNAQLTCRYTRARNDILIARLADHYERGWNEYDFVVADSSGLTREQVRRLRAEARARDDLVELQEAAGNDRRRLLRGLRRVHHPAHLGSRDWDALMSTIQREQSVCR